MKKILFVLSFLLLTTITLAQSKVSGIVVDKKNQVVPFANVAFKNSREAILANEDGHFYLESPKTYTTLVVSFDSYQDREITLTKAVNYDLKIVLKESESLKEVVVYRGKTSKKNNPALDILRKIWERRRKNGLNMFNQYQYSKYEKVEFDMNTIDSAFRNKKLFKGMEFIFKSVDTSKVTGKTYLPIFINEALYDVYGDNQNKRYKDELKANKNSGLDNNDGVNTFIKDLYSEYDIYNNYITFFDKSFTSPLSKTGIDVYNYVLSDTATIDNKRCYNIHFYPRRKSELTFKGDFWVNDTTWAIKKINMAVTKSANINWVKDIYIEQEFEVMNDSVFLLTRDYLMTDFALDKKEGSKGVYGKRTTLAKNHIFNQPIPESIFKQKINFFDEEAYKKSEAFWQDNRFERLNKDELGVYKMLDTLKTVKKFRDMYNLVTILTTGYIKKPSIDYGPVLSVIGYNEVEGLRLRVGARTYFGKHDLWRLQGYTAYGFKDQEFKYGFSGKWMFAKEKRWMISGGNRHDVEQIGASLTATNDVLGRSFASSGLLTTGNNGKLTKINLTNIALEVEPIKNVVFGTSFSYRTLESASKTFSLDYYTDLNQTEVKSKVEQAEFNFQMDWTPNRVTTGFGVERKETTNPYPRIFVNYTKGVKGLLDSDFAYQKLQLFYKQPIQIGAIGRTYITTELGKTFGNVPLGLMNIVPGNQSVLNIQNTFSNLNFYEFVADKYATLQVEHNFGGRLFARIPAIRKLNWREIVGIRTVIGTVTEENKLLNASGLIYNAPTKPYWEYSAGIGNIFKVLRLDFAWRGNYKDLPDANNFTIKGSFGIYF
jgi:Family of unknown function (DUF5686)/CarboxypepD_reg-like domain